VTHRIFSRYRSLTVFDFVHFFLIFTASECSTDRRTANNHKHRSTLLAWCSSTDTHIKPMTSHLPVRRAREEDPSAPAGAKAENAAPERESQLEREHAEYLQRIATSKAPPKRKSCIARAGGDSMQILLRQQQLEEQMDRQRAAAAAAPAALVDDPRVAALERSRLAAAKKREKKRLQAAKQKTELPVNDEDEEEEEEEDEDEDSA
jgi:hypothetical protein